MLHGSPVDTLQQVVDHRGSNNLALNNPLILPFTEIWGFLMVGV